MSCSVSGKRPTGCDTYTAQGLNQVLQVPVWLCYVVLVGHVPWVADHQGLNQVLQVPVWLCHVVLVGNVPQVVTHTLRRG
jgi:hypothetical protein